MAELIKQMLMANASSTASPLDASAPPPPPSPYVSLSGAVSLIDRVSGFSTRMTEESIKTNGTAQIRFHLPPPSRLFALPVEEDHSLMASTDRAELETTPCVRLAEVPLYYPSPSDPSPVRENGVPFIACLPRKAGELETAIETAGGLFWSEYVAGGQGDPNALEERNGKILREPAVPPTLETPLRKDNKGSNEVLASTRVVVMQPALLRLGALQALLLLADPPPSSRPSAHFTLMHCGLQSTEFAVHPVGSKTPRRYAVQAVQEYVTGKSLWSASSSAPPGKKRARSPPNPDETLRSSSAVGAFAADMSAKTPSQSVTAFADSSSQELSAHVHAALRLDPLPNSNLPSVEDASAPCSSYYYVPLDALMELPLSSVTGLREVLARGTAVSNPFEGSIMMQWSSELREKEGRSVNGSSATEKKTLQDSSAVEYTAGEHTHPPVATRAQAHTDTIEPTAPLIEEEEESVEQRWARLLDPASRLSSVARGLSLSAFSLAAHLSWCREVLLRLNGFEASVEKQNSLHSPSSIDTAKGTRGTWMLIGNPQEPIHATIAKWISIIIVGVDSSAFVYESDNEALVENRKKSVQYQNDRHVLRSCSLAIRVQGCSETLEWGVMDDLIQKSKAIGAVSEVRMKDSNTEGRDLSPYRGTFNELLESLSAFGFAQKWPGKE